MELSRLKPSRTLIEWLGWGIGSLLLLTTIVYGFFWLPYRNPEESVPRIPAILPHQPVLDRQEDSLHNYEWVEPQTGVVRIPIEMAMELVRERLPVRENAEQELEKIQGNTIPTGAGSGRTVSRD